MKNTIPIILLVFLFLACENAKETNKTENDTDPQSLPFTLIDLEDLSAFQPTSPNWKTAKEVLVNRSKENDINAIDGEGILVNLANQQENAHLLTAFEHGDIELEVEVMMPKGSNSGLYFQSRYEIQLFDSWLVEQPKFSDMGGVYEGPKGEEGFPPKLNAAKAPGLWQHFKVLFHAPRFDTSGKKIKNAEFEKVWLNGVLIHENLEVTGPTRAGVDTTEVSRAPLMIQGDHGPVALKNLKYKLYGPKQISLGEISVKEFDYSNQLIPDLDTLQPIRNSTGDSISAAIITEGRVSRLVDFQGVLKIPEKGKYLFNVRLNSAGGRLVIGNDTVVDLDGAYDLNQPAIGLVELSEGEVPFRFIYNKHNQWRQGFRINYEGPGIQYRELSSPESLVIREQSEEDKVVIEVADEVVMQRGFLMHGGAKRTHSIAVGAPEGVHFAYDLAAGAILAAWRGDFYDVTEMWFRRGIEQLGRPIGFAIWFSGAPQFAKLESKSSSWPVHDFEASPQPYDGYEIDDKGFPSFLREVGGVQIKDKVTPSKDNRGLTRKIVTEGDGQIWHKIGEGNQITKLADGTFRVDGVDCFIQILNNGGQPIIRSSGEKDELLVQLPSGNQQLEYNIIW